MKSKNNVFTLTYNPNNPYPINVMNQMLRYRF